MLNLVESEKKFYDLVDRLLLKLVLAGGGRRGRVAHFITGH